MNSGTASQEHKRLVLDPKKSAKIVSICGFQMIGTPHSASSSERLRRPLPRRPFDWSATTFEGSEREQLRIWRMLPLQAKLEALEEMCDHARQTLAQRTAHGLPSIDPFTGELMSPGFDESH